MTQVSRRRLRPDIEKRIYELFWQSVARLKNAKEAEIFFSDLLTRTERIMLAKRLAIAILLLKGYDYDAINEILKVSGTTIAKVKTWLHYEGEGYRRIAERLAREESWRGFADFLNQLFPRYSHKPIPDRVFRRKTPL